MFFGEMVKKVGERIFSCQLVNFAVRHDIWQKENYEP